MSVNVGITHEKSYILLLDKIRKELSSISSNITNLLVTGVGVVPNYSALPPANTSLKKLYWVENSQGTRWLPWTLGGTYYPKGLYYSNGVTWSHMETPYQATQQEVLDALDNDKFVTPLTLQGKIDTLDLNKGVFTIDLMDELDVTFYAPYDLRINSFQLIVGSDVILIKINDVPYTGLGDLINQGDKITVEAASNLVVNLNVEYE
jgi:hypothetical protein